MFNMKTPNRGLKQQGANMNIRLFTVLLAATLAMPLSAQAKDENQGQHEKAQAYKAQQHEENKAFRDSLKDVPEGQREAAIINHRNSQFADNMTQHATMHATKMSELKAKLDQNTNLTEAQKQEIIAKVEKEYQDNTAKAQAKHTEGINYAQQVMSDESLSPEQKKEKMKAYHEENKADREKFREERKAKRENLREEFKKRKNRD